MLDYKIYNNQKRTASKIKNSIILGNKRIHLVAPTQSGKTGTIIHLANIMPEDNFILTSGMMENHLYNQNSNIAEIATTNIKAIKINSLLKEPNPKKIVRDLDIKHIVIDESHYGIGEKSRLDVFIDDLHKTCPDVTIVWVGATGYQLVNSDFIDDTIQMEVPDSYYGASDILKSDKFIESSNFEYLSKLGSKDRLEMGVDYGVVINDEMIKVLDYLKSFKNGIGIVRVQNRGVADVLKESLNNRFPYAKVLVAVSGKEQSISDIIKDARMISSLKRVILIVCGGLKAGIDLGETKSRVRFVIETYKTFSSVSQGLIGRVCGYHENRDCLFVANKRAVELQAMYEEDYRIVNDEFLSEILGNESVNLATNFKYSSKYNTKSEYYYEGSVYKVKNHNELKDEWFSEYKDGYKSKVADLMIKIKDSNGSYQMKYSDNLDSYNRINTIQSEKFRDRSMFDSYLKKVSGRVNFSSVFHRFAKTSEGRRRGGVKGGRSNEQYAKDIKVGILYDNSDSSFYIAIRDTDKVKKRKIVSITNKTIFNS